MTTYDLKRHEYHQPLFISNRNTLNKQQIFDKKNLINIIKSVYHITINYGRIQYRPQTQNKAITIRKYSTKSIQYYLLHPILMSLAVNWRI